MHSCYALRQTAWHASLSRHRAMARSKAGCIPASAEAHLARQLHKGRSLISPDLNGLLGQVGLPVCGSLAATCQQSNAYANGRQWAQLELKRHLHMAGMGRSKTINMFLHLQNCKQLKISVMKEVRLIQKELYKSKAHSIRDVHVKVCLLHEVS